jgi:hypothetical protein
VDVVGLAEAVVVGAVGLDGVDVAGEVVVLGVDVSVDVPGDTARGDAGPLGRPEPTPPHPASSTATAVATTAPCAARRPRIAHPCVRR